MKIDLDHKIESPQNEKYTKDLGQKGINLFGKNKPFKFTGFYFEKQSNN